MLYCIFPTIFINVTSLQPSSCNVKASGFLMQGFLQNHLHARIPSLLQW
jgi:hypothetical protein